MAPIQGSLQWRHLRIPLAVGAAVLLVHALLITLDLGGPDATNLAGNLFLILVPLVAAHICGWAALGATGHIRTSWALMSAANASWALGQAIWTYYERQLGVTVPFPSWADAGYLLFTPFAIASVLFYQPPKKIGNLPIRVAVDGLIIIVSLFFISWATALRIVAQAGVGLPLIERAIAIAYPLGNLVVAALVFLTIGRIPPHARRAFLWVAGGMIAFTIADSAYAYLTYEGLYRIGHPVDLGWSLGFVLLAIGAYRHRRSEAPDAPFAEPAARSRLRQIVPYLPAIGALYVAARLQILEGRLENLLFWVFLALVGLVIARQALAAIEIQRLSTEKADAFARLKVVEQYRLQLMNTIAHDIRGPLTPVVIQTHLLRTEGPALTAEQSDAISIVERSVRQVERLAQDFQDVAKMEAGQFRVRRQPLDLAKVVREAAEPTRAVAKTRQLQLEIHAADGLIVDADAGRLTQVVHNLLNNAIKFTPNGGWIVVSAERR
ncbi:MAG TPA: HAMP domain-containing sensor histidine kinase, partial [Candidatus Thermoplasmatota archaeon]|nr:HAMP domain-containing sensor histidine kinase [Candidatus Thermoplasmatota archaeon]